MLKEVVIIAGANGSGKTTFAKSCEKKYPFEFVNADEIAKEIDPKDIERTRVTAGKLFFKKISDLLKTDQNFIIESTLSGRTLSVMIEEMKERGYSITLIYTFLESPVICIERIKERVLKGGHHVPEEDVVRRFYRSKMNFWNLYKELVDKWHLIYNSEQQFIEFAFGRKEIYTVNDEKLFESFIRDINKEKDDEGR